MRAIALSLLLAFSLAGTCRAQSFSDKARKDQIDVIPEGDPAMVAAVRKARATFAGFLEASRHPKPGTDAYAVKIGLGPAGRQEFFWLSPFTVANDEVQGQLDNTPETIPGYKKGDTVKLPLSRVTDWMYIDNGAMQGNYSACALLTHESASERAAFEREYGMSCEGK